MTTLRRVITKCSRYYALGQGQRGRSEQRCLTVRPSRNCERHVDLNGKCSFAQCESGSNPLHVIRDLTRECSSCVIRARVTGNVPTAIQTGRAGLLSCTGRQPAQYRAKSCVYTRQHTNTHARRSSSEERKFACTITAFCRLERSGRSKETRGEQQVADGCWLVASRLLAARRATSARAEVRAWPLGLT